MVDQALFAGSNFIVSILLGRWLIPAHYGAFSTAYSVFLLLGTLYQALFTEPMVVYGSGRFREALDSYRNVLVNYHLKFGIASGLIFLITGFVTSKIGQHQLGGAFIGLALAAPCILYLWLIRRGAYILLEPRLSAVGGGIYMALYLGMVLLLVHLGALSGMTAFWSMGLSALLAGMWVKKNITSQVGTSDIPLNPKEVLRVHWDYGRWALIAGGLSWVPSNIYFVMLPAFWGLASSALFRALTNLIMPILQLNTAISGLFVPMFVRLRGTKKLSEAVAYATFVLQVFAILYWILLSLFSPKIMLWLYGGKYDADGYLFWLGLIPIFMSMISISSALYRSFEQPVLIARFYGFSALITLILGVSAIFTKGIKGAVFSYVASYIVTAFIFLLGLKQVYGRPRDE